GTGCRPPSRLPPAPRPHHRTRSQGRGPRPPARITGGTPMTRRRMSLAEIAAGNGQYTNGKPARRAAAPSPAAGGTAAETDDPAGLFGNAAELARLAGLMKTTPAEFGIEKARLKKKGVCIPDLMRALRRAASGVADPEPARPTRQLYTLAH